MLLLMHGCASVTTSAPETATTPKPAAPPAPRPAALVIERQWLQSWFKGTPVRIEQRSESAFSIEVPREYCFDPGRSAVQPPLAAVLDKLAQSLQRKPETRIERIAAPGDVAGNAAGHAALAQQRGDSVRKYLSARGVSSQRLAAPSATGEAALQLQIVLDAP